MLSNLELALARQRTYQLFSDLFHTGPTAASWPTLQDIPELAVHRPPALTPDQEAAAHYQAVSDTILPFESVFLDSSGLIGGAINGAVAATYLSAGYEPAGEADALGSELGYLAYLCAAEAYAHQHGDTQTALAIQQDQVSFLNDHLLAWLPPLTAALHLGPDPFYAALGDLSLTLAAEHFAALPSTAVSPDLPQAPDLLGDEGTSLRQISAYLLTPPYSGIYLGRATITGLARAHRLPRGFGKRRQMLRNLLETSGQYDSAAAIFDGLIQVTAATSTHYQQQLSALPMLAAFLRPWQERAAATDSFLEQMRDLAISAI